MDNLTKHRKTRLLALVEGAPYNGNQQAFALKARLSKGRISQLLDPDESFGERSAKALALRLNLAERYFEDGFGEAATQSESEPLRSDGERFTYWLNKIADRDLRERARDAAMQILYSAGDGQWPPVLPTPEPKPPNKKPLAARQTR